ncbi:MAG: hypothetical protein AB2L26_05635 [Ignavibacteria bacterium]
MFSEEINNLAQDINDFSKGNIKNIFELSLFIGISEKNNRESDFQDILFGSKYLYGLAAVLSDVRNSELINDNLKSEFSSTLLSLKNKITVYIEGLQGEKKFTDKFLGISQDCLNNFLSLVADFAVAKEYYNSKKFNGIS